jgi:sigma-B regulation protein RsbU (phosphoserine phosphatase)
MGKGMPAALLMSNLQATVKAFASDGMPPKELCRKINRVISSNTGVGRFISFFYGLLDAEQERLVYANAGHNAPILQRRDGTVIRLEEGGAVLGIFPDGNYEQGEVELGSGDSVLLFTDGVTEVRNAAEEEFGEERLIGLLAQNREFSAAEVQKRLLEAVTEFSQGNFQDDATLVVMSVE